MEDSYIQTTTVDFDLEQSKKERNNCLLRRWWHGLFLLPSGTAAACCSYGLLAHPQSYGDMAVTATLGLVSAGFVIYHIQHYFDCIQYAEEVDYKIFENTGDITNCKFPEAVQMKYNRQPPFVR